MNSVSKVLRYALRSRPQAGAILRSHLQLDVRQCAQVQLLLPNDSTCGARFASYKSSPQSSTKQSVQSVSAGDDECDAAVDPDFTLDSSSKVQKPHGDVEVTEAERKGAFSNFNLSEEMVRKLKARNIEYLFPAQAEPYQPITEGKDVIVRARTGTGKTLSFVIPLVEKLHREGNRERGRPPKVVTIVPTRELANQVANDFQSVTDKLNVISIYGGAKYEPQERAFVDGVDIVVGTPGRLLDLIEKGACDLSQVDHVVLDEVDRMLDMGFAEIVDNILRSAYERKSAKPQTLLWSATTPPWVFKTAKKYMTDLCNIDLIGQDRVKTATSVQHVAIKCNPSDRGAIIGDLLKVYVGAFGRAMVFCEMKRDADKLAVGNFISQETHVLHGDIPQEKREIVLKGFRSGRYKVLLTTDVASRGLDIPEVELIIQCSPPKDLDDYIHRSGRTGRAGKIGTSICLHMPSEQRDLQDVERNAGIRFKKISPPTNSEIISAVANDSIKVLDGVSEKMYSYFMKPAQQLVDEKGAVQALAAALAVISGTTELQERSLLSHRPGHTTYVLNTQQPLSSKSYAYRNLKSQIPFEIVEKISGMRFLHDHMGVVFDLPSSLNNALDDNWVDREDTLTKPTTLPEIEPEQDYQQRDRNQNVRGYGSKGQRYQSSGYRNSYRTNRNTRDNFNRNMYSDGSSPSEYGDWESQDGYSEDTQTRHSDRKRNQYGKRSNRSSYFDDSY